jgi:tRNA threonylcarbamoyl adenosine modification protein YeaZ
MISLVMDTATDHGVVGLFSQGTLIGKKEFAAAFNNSKQLLPAVDELIGSCGVKLSDLTYVAAGMGPGSYTGIRVTAALAKGICFALHIPLVAVSSLKGFIPKSSYQGAFLAAIDAKIGGVYCLAGHMTDGVVSFDTQEELLSVEEFSKKLTADTLLITPSIAPLRARMEIQSPFIEQAPSIEWLGKFAHLDYLAGRGASDGHLPLLYLRKTQAEIEREAKERTFDLM